MNKMIIRAIEYDQDIPEIVSLLRTSLSVNHTEESFLWKHLENPFGRSYGLVACSDNKIIGVRMFMFWEFYKSGEVIKAIRPVDTITHPDFRGKGIFKELTLRGLEDCRGEYTFVFNTPNNNSLAGYLKMGWKRYEKNLHFKVALLLPLIGTPGKVKISPINEIDIQPAFMSPNVFRTNFTNSYIRWRYKSDKYRAAQIEFNGQYIFIFFKVERIKGLKIMIVQDILGDERLHKNGVRKLGHYLRIFFIYYLKSPLLNINFLVEKERQNATVVVKSDKYRIPLLSFSAGDLEGRI